MDSIQDENSNAEAPGRALLGRLAPPAVLDEWASSLGSHRWPEPPRGDGAPAMLIPGFMAGDASLARMAKWLKKSGYSLNRPGIRWNVDCLGATVTAVEARLEAAVDRHGKPALIVGQSRGGVIGRALAVRRPELIQSLVTLGSPLRDQMAIHSRTRLAVAAVGRLGTLGVPGMFSRDCRAGECCEDVRPGPESRFPSGVRFVSIYSPTDRVVRFESCLDPAAEQVEVSSSHEGMGLNLDVWRAIARSLHGD